jgi:hypothetical protein
MVSTLSLVTKMRAYPRSAAVAFGLAIAVQVVELGDGEIVSSPAEDVEAKQCQLTCLPGGVDRRAGVLLCRLHRLRVGAFRMVAGITPSVKVAEPPNGAAAYQLPVFHCQDRRSAALPHASSNAGAGPVRLDIENCDAEGSVRTRSPSRAAALECRGFEAGTPNVLRQRPGHHSPAGTGWCASETGSRSASTSTAHQRFRGNGHGQLVDLQSGLPVLRQRVARPGSRAPGALGIYLPGRWQRRYADRHLWRCRRRARRPARRQRDQGRHLDVERALGGLRLRSSINSRGSDGATQNDGRRLVSHVFATGLPDPNGAGSAYSNTRAMRLPVWTNPS